MNLSDSVVRSIENGDATLFLGAGCSMGAKNDKGQPLPTGAQLAKELRDEFMRGKGPDNLAMVCELLSAVDAGQVARYVEDRVRRTTPTPSFHERLPSYRWRAIVTTNYDQLIEKCYESGITLQNGRAVITEDELAGIKPEKRDLPIVKLHGCCTRPPSMSLSMSDLHRRRRDAALLFSHVEQLHVLGPVIYIGYSLSDQHVLDWVLDLTRRLGQFRPPIVFVGSPTEDNWLRVWVERVLKGQYLPLGADKFIEELLQRAQPPIAASKILAAPFTPCRATRIAGHGEAKIEMQEVNGQWQCMLEYTIRHEEGFACVVFDRFEGVADLSNRQRIVFELYMSEGERRDPRIEALKIESPTALYPYLLDTSSIPRGRWVQQTIETSEYKEVDLDKVVRIGVADNGHRARLGQSYRIGIRNVKFE